MAAEVTKPDFSYVWASGGAIVAPSDVKKQTGWVAEVPPFQWENYLQNRQDNAILHLFQKGISEWDALSNYYFTASGVRSYVQGSDGVIYVAVQDSIGQNPVTDSSDTYWKIAFSSTDLANTTTAGIVELATTAEMTTGTSPTLVPPVAAIAAQMPFRGIVAYTTAGSYSWVVPAGVTVCQVTVQGGGAGGGGANTAGAAAGGGAGGFTEGLIPVTPGSSITVVVGAGGAGGTNAPTNGTNGGTSSFGSTLIATGGTGGQLNLGGISTVPGPSGTGSGGYLNLSGGFAGQGYQVTGGYTGGLGAAPQFGSVPVQNVATQGVAATALGGGGNGAAAIALGGTGKSGYVVIKY